MVIVVTGVSGSGKTSVGRAVAQRLGWQFADADQFHSEVAKGRMRSGRPLTDEDRDPWLRRIAGWIGDHLASEISGVVTCSALKRSYRDLLGEGEPGVEMVYLHADPDLIRRRMSDRPGHFFPPALLDSQLQAVQPPEPDEDVLTVTTEGSAADAAEEIIKALGLDRSG